MRRKSFRKVDTAVVWPTVVIKMEKVLFQTLCLGLRVNNGAAVLPDKDKECRLMFEQVGGNLVSQVAWSLDPNMSH